MSEEFVKVFGSLLVIIGILLFSVSFSGIYISLMASLGVITWVKLLCGAIIALVVGGLISEW